MAAILSAKSQLNIRITIRPFTKQSFTNLRLFCPIQTGADAKKTFFTLFSVFDKIKQCKQQQKTRR
jgi:hypothetical protein